MFEGADVLKCAEGCIIDSKCVNGSKAACDAVRPDPTLRNILIFCGIIAAIIGAMAIYLNFFKKEEEDYDRV